MKVLLIHPNCGFQPLPQAAPLGLLSIAAFLKQRGYQVRVYDRNVEKLSLQKVLRTFAPDAAGLCVATMMHVHDSVAISRRLRNDGIPVIWGGHMASIEPEMILRENAADYVVIGEGEITFHELLQAIENKSGTAQVKGIAAIDETGAVRRTPERRFADLADFPVIDWSLVDPAKFFAPRFGCKRVMFLYVSKGCPGSCAFCINTGYHHSRHRQRPNEYVISEIRELTEKHGMDGVYFVDEIFGLRKTMLHDLCRRLRGLETGIHWGCETKLGLMSREDYQAMYDAGCRWIYFGIESGSPEMQKRIRKNIDLEKIEGEIQLCREIGISTNCGIILGFPDETEEQLQETVSLLLRLAPNLVQAVAFFPMPGSAYCSQLVNEGRLILPQTLREWGSFAPLTSMFINFSDVPTRDLRVIQSFFSWRSFTRRDFPKDAAKRYSFALNTIAASLRNILRQGLLKMLRYAFTSARLFLTIAWYAHAFPGIRKKYGLRAK